MKSTNVSVYGETPTGRCGWCLKATWNGADTCSACRSIEPNLRRGYTENDGLEGGRWVTRGGIKVWTGTRPVDDEQVVVRPPAQCGTESGYSRHLRLSERTCDACRRAKSQATRKRYAQAKGDAA